MQGEGHGQAAGGGEGQFGPAGADQARRGAGEERTAFQRQPENIGSAAGLGKPSDDLGALAGLRGDEHRLAVEWHQLTELFGERQGQRIDAERAVERLDGAPDRVRTAHAEQQQTACLPD